MSGQFSITGRDIGTGAGVEIVCQNGVVADIKPYKDPDPGYLAPSLFDLQVNGYGGLDLNDGAVTAEGVEALCMKLAVLGVSRFLPTLITASEKGFIAGLVAINQACETGQWAAQMVAGVHVEGPSISSKDGPRGAHPIDHIRPPSLVEFARWQKASGNRVRMVTIAPEVPGAIDYIKALATQGVLLAIGHTAASSEDIRAAADAGATLSTHLGNGVAGQMPRHPNLIWAQLAEDRLTATFIADGHHLPADTFKAMLCAKGLQRSVLVSDSVGLAGLPAGHYAPAIGGDVEMLDNGKITLTGTPYLAGAGLPLVSGISGGMRMAGLELAEAFALASDNPRKLLGEQPGLMIGARADILRFELAEEMEIQIQEHWIAGRQVGS